MASTFGQERAMPTWVACAARVRIDRTTGYVTVEKLTLVIDAGTIIQPNMHYLGHIFLRSPSASIDTSIVAIA